MAGQITRDRILDVAEVLFAERGFHDVSLRQIATEARIRISNVQYHYQSKDDIYYAVFKRRIMAINQDRLTRFDQIERGDTETKDHVAQIVRAFVGPVVEVSQGRESGGKYYAQLVSQIFNDPSSHARRISEDFNDPIARIVMRTLSEAMPDMDADTLAYVYLFAVGALIASISQTGRVEKLSKNTNCPTEANQIMDMLVPFVAGGIAAVNHTVADRGTSNAVTEAEGKSEHAASKSEKGPQGSM